MSQEFERIYTINLGKVLLSPDNRRAKRAINMIKEFVIHHMHTNKIKINSDINNYVWKNGIRNPPRKIKVKITKIDDAFLVSKYVSDSSTDEKKIN